MKSEGEGNSRVFICRSTSYSREADRGIKQPYQPYKESIRKKGGQGYLFWRRAPAKRKTLKPSVQLLFVTPGSAVVPRSARAPNQPIHRRRNGGMVASPRIVSGLRANQPAPGRLTLPKCLQAWRHNATHHLTGVLLYAAGRFLQVLEGPRAKVEALFTRLQRDASHHYIRVVGRGPVRRREFPHWGMGFRQLSYPLWAQLRRLLRPQPAINATSPEPTQVLSVGELVQPFVLYPMALA